MTNFYLHLYVNPAICVHRSPEFEERQGKVWLRCDTCNLYGPPVTVGWLKWWADGRAARGFYKLANQLGRSAATVLALIVLSCSAIVPEKIDPGLDASQNDLVDAAGDDQSDSSENTDSADTLDTSDTGIDTDTDTDGCPWACKPELFGQTAPFACSDPWVNEPTAIVNYLGDCPNRGLCCQPWPPPDHPLAVRDLCGNGWTCGSTCPSGVMSASVCFASNDRCCESLRSWSI